MLALRWRRVIIFYYGVLELLSIASIVDIVYPNNGNIEVALEFNCQPAFRWESWLFLVLVSSNFNSYSRG
jgi:hypothetical protein